MPDQFYSFEEALKELRLKEEELKRLVSEGEIRAFREGDTMKLRRADVENLRSELSGGEVVDLGEVKEELVFEDDVEVSDEAGMATEEISDVETILEEPADAPVDEVAEIAIEEEVALIEDDEVGAGTRRAAPRVVIAAPEIEEPTEARGIRVAMLLTTILLLLALPLCLSIAQGHPSGLSRAIANIFP